MGDEVVKDSACIARDGDGNPRPCSFRGQYTIEYYLEFARQLNELGIHVLAIKDMAGLLKPTAARLLVSQEQPGVCLFQEGEGEGQQGV